MPDSKSSGVPTSIIVGGPMYETMVRLGLWEMPRRIAVFWALTWLPLCILSALGGLNDLVAFLTDLPAQVRFLLAAPLLVIAERIIAPRVAEVTGYFTSSGLVSEEERSAYQRALERLERSCRAALPEAFLILAAYGAALFWFRREADGDVSGWVHAGGTGIFRLSAAGWCYALMSIPVYQFVVYRWVWRSILWFQFLWRVSRLNLRLLPTHPDLAGGLGYLGVGQAAFGAIIFPVSAVIAAIEGEKMRAGLETFHEIRFALVGLVAVFTGFIMMPLLFFAGQLLAAKRRAQLEYGLLAQSYVHQFNQRWVEREGDGHELLGTSDIQSLADIQNSVGSVLRMRTVPIDRTTLIMIVGAAALPMLPLALTEVPIDEVMKKLMGILI